MFVGRGRPLEVTPSKLDHIHRPFSLHRRSGYNEILAATSLKNLSYACQGNSATSGMNRPAKAPSASTRTVEQHRLCQA